VYELRIESYFASAHQLREYNGKCENLHGHNWKVCLAIRGERLDSCGMLMDFVELKKILKMELDKLDHRFLNDLPAFSIENPTSEYIAKYLFEAVKLYMPTHIDVASVTVWESESCSATYQE